MPAKSATTSEQPTGPWYRHYGYWRPLAGRYMAAYLNLPADAPHHAEIQAFRELSSFRLIFESNLIEGAGLSQGETRKVISDHFPRIPSSYEAFRETAHSGLEFLTFPEKQLARMRAAIRAHDLSLEEVRLSFSFRGRSRGIWEVVQHFFAYLRAESMTLRYRSAWERYWLARHLRDSEGDTRRRDRIWTNATGERRFPRLVAPRLLTKKRVRDLHTTMAKGLLPKDAGVLAGEFRVDSRTVGYDVAFPAPELVAGSMKGFLRNANALLKDWAEQGGPIMTACRTSYDFARIHPFPDFNGRMSRLIMNMVLMACSAPFPIALRGNKKGRARYLRSLRYANRGNLEPYATLIAMGLVRGFEEVDGNVRAAGLPSILSFADNA